jgi:hypothetical protein
MGEKIQPEHVELVVLMTALAAAILIACWVGWC